MRYLNPNLHDSKAFSVVPRTLPLALRNTPSKGTGRVGRFGLEAHSGSFGNHSHVKPFVSCWIHLAHW